MHQTQERQNIKHHHGYTAMYTDCRIVQVISRLACFHLVVFILKIEIGKSFSPASPWAISNSGNIPESNTLLNGRRRGKIRGDDFVDRDGEKQESIKVKPNNTGRLIKKNDEGIFSSTTERTAASKKYLTTLLDGQVREKHPTAIASTSPENRIEYIRSRIESIDLSDLTECVPNQQLDYDINPNSICVVDNFLGPDLIALMRQEAESYLPSMVPSQSTRWDEDSKSVVPYDKTNVLSTQIEGGIDEYQKSPHLIEYIVTLTSSLSRRLNEILPELYQLSEKHQTNKLAVCLGGGSSYDKHIDNLGGSDLRKLTALLYLQPPGLPYYGKANFPNENHTDDVRGGYFRAYDVPNKGDITCIAPRSDRLVLFWSDSLVHDVSASFAPDGDIDRRWALTIWLVVSNNKRGSIRSTDDDVTKSHFGNDKL